MPKYVTMTEIELGANLTAILTTFITMIAAYLTGRGIIKVCPLDRFKKTKPEV